MAGSSGIEIKVLTLETGKCPFEDWYKSIKDVRTRARIDSRLVRIWSGNYGDSKSVGGGVSELRMDFGPGYRVYFASVGEVVVILLGGGDKSTQARDIQDAQALWERNRNVPERFERDYS